MYNTYQYKAIIVEQYRGLDIYNSMLASGWEPYNETAGSSENGWLCILRKEVFLDKQTTDSL